MAELTFTALLSILYVIQACRGARTVWEVHKKRGAKGELLDHGL